MEIELRGVNLAVGEMSANVYINGGLRGSVEGDSSGIIYSSQGLCDELKSYADELPEVEVWESDSDGVHMSKVRLSPERLIERLVHREDVARRMAGCILLVKDGEVKSMKTEISSEMLDAILSSPAWVEKFKAKHKVHPDFILNGMHIDDIALAVGDMPAFLAKQASESLSDAPAMSI
ncbi:MAG: hypothetical protein Q8O64_05815 [Sideroxyarcus sp.]|nr:hypothetical protein [Sideroxyarcus sp.]